VLEILIHHSLGQLLRADFADRFAVVEQEYGVFFFASQVRSGWAEAFAKMSAHGDDRLLDDVELTDWTEWEW
jgi:hypothetical protein